MYELRKQTITNTLHAQYANNHTLSDRKCTNQDVQ